MAQQQTDPSANVGTFDHLAALRKIQDRGSKNRIAFLKAKIAEKEASDRVLLDNRLLKAEIGQVNQRVVAGRNKGTKEGPPADLPPEVVPPSQPVTVGGTLSPNTQGDATGRILGLVKGGAGVQKGQRTTADSLVNVSQNAPGFGAFVARQLGVGGMQVAQGRLGDQGARGQAFLRNQQILEQEQAQVPIRREQRAQTLVGIESGRLSKILTDRARLGVDPESAVENSTPDARLTQELGTIQQNLAETLGVDRGQRAFQEVQDTAIADARTNQSAAKAEALASRIDRSRERINQLELERVQAAKNIRISQVDRAKALGFQPSGLSSDQLIDQVRNVSREGEFDPTRLGVVSALQRDWEFLHDEVLLFNKFEPGAGFLSRLSEDNNTSTIPRGRLMEAFAVVDPRNRRPDTTQSDFNDATEILRAVGFRPPVGDLNDLMVLDDRTGGLVAPKFEDGDPNRDNLSRLFFKYMEMGDDNQSIAPPEAPIPEAPPPPSAGPVTSEGFSATPSSTPTGAVASEGFPPASRLGADFLKTMERIRRLGIGSSAERQRILRERAGR